MTELFKFNNLLTRDKVNVALLILSAGFFFGTISSNGSHISVATESNAAAIVKLDDTLAQTRVAIAQLQVSLAIENQEVKDLKENLKDLNAKLK